MGMLERGGTSECFRHREKRKCIGQDRQGLEQLKGGQCG